MKCLLLFYVLFKELQTRVAKNLRNTSLNLNSKFIYSLLIYFWDFNLKEFQILVLKSPQKSTFNQKIYWPHSHLKIWGFWEFLSNKNFWGSSKNLKFLSFFVAFFTFFTIFFEESSKNLNNLNLILTLNFEVYTS